MELILGGTYIVIAKVAHSCAERERDRLAPLTDYFSRVITKETTPLLPSHLSKVRRRSSNLWGDPCRKRLLKSNEQTNKDHIPADGEEPTSVKSIRYNKKQHVNIVLYARHHWVSSH